MTSVSLLREMPDIYKKKMCLHYSSDKCHSLFKNLLQIGYSNTHYVKRFVRNGPLFQP